MKTSLEIKTALARNLTLARPDGKSSAAWIACAEPEIQAEFLDGLSNEALLALPYLFDFWAMEHQVPPAGDWRTWVALGGARSGEDSCRGRMGAGAG